MKLLALARTVTFAALLSVSGLVFAQQPPAAPGSIGAPTVRDVTKQMGVVQRLGAQIPGDLKFMSDEGKEIQLKDLMGKRPLLLVPVFYNCQSACLLEMDAMTKSLRKTQRIVPGREFDVVFISIHPKETWELARATKARMMEAYGRPETEDGWHFLVGEHDAVQKITEVVGFQYTYDAANDRINHPIAAMFISNDGRVSSYIANGVNYPTKILESGAERANRNEIGQKTDVYLFGCLMVDPATGQRSMVIHNVLRLASIFTVIALIASIAYMSNKYRRDTVAVGGKAPRS